MRGRAVPAGIADAANAVGLSIWRIGPAALTSRVTELLSWSPERTDRELVAVRADIGPPWQKDHKEVLLAALLGADPQRARSFKTPRRG